jgi:hypothetical protein
MYKSYISVIQKSKKLGPKLAIILPFLYLPSVTWVHPGEQARDDSELLNFLAAF